MKHVLFAIVAGCGSVPVQSNNGATSAPTPTKNVGVYGGAEYGGYHKTPELAKFRGLIAGASAREACAISSDLDVAAAAIAKAPPPAVDLQGTWAGETGELAAIAQDFVTSCAGTDAAAIDDDLRSMNRSFQRLLLQVRGSGG